MCVCLGGGGGRVVSMPCMVGVPLGADLANRKIERLVVSTLEVERERYGVTDCERGLEVNQHHVESTGLQANLFAGGHIDALDLAHLEGAVFLNVGVQLDGRGGGRAASQHGCMVL